MRPSWNVWRADYRLLPSRRLLGLLIGLHGLALVAIWRAYIPWGWAVLASLLVLLAALQYARRWRRPGAGQVVAFAERGTQWWLQTGDGREHLALLQADTLLWRFVLVLRFRVAGRRLALSAVILPDSLPPEGFRRLYVRLRLRRTVAEALREEPS